MLFIILKNPAAGPRHKLKTKYKCLSYLWVWQQKLDIWIDNKCDNNNDEMKCLNKNEFIYFRIPSSIERSKSWQLGLNRRPIRFDRASQSTWEWIGRFWKENWRSFEIFTPICSDANPESFLSKKPQISSNCSMMERRMGRSEIFSLFCFFIFLQKFTFVRLRQY